LYLLNCALLNAFFVYRTLTRTKHKVQELPAPVERSRISKVQNTSEPSSDELQWPETQPVPRGPQQDPQCRLFGDFSKHKLDKIVAGGEGKKKYPARQCKECAKHKKRSEATYICKFCVAALHKGSCLERYHPLRNHWNLYVQFLQYWAQEFHLYRQMITKNPFRGFTLKVCKMSGNWGDLIKGSSRRQCVKKFDHALK
jgi:hypothetical protein